MTWEPDTEVLARSQLTRLIGRLGLGGYDELYAYSLSDTERFWSATLELLDIPWDTPYTELVSYERGPHLPSWFVGGRLNAARLALRHDPQRRALSCENERGDTEALTYGELADAVGRLAAGLRARGVREGDRVGLFLTMNADAVAAFLAVASIGAIAVPLFSGFGAEAAASRLALAGATCLIAVESFARRGRAVELLPVVERIRDAVPGLREIVVRRTGSSALPSWAHDWDDVAGAERVDPIPLPSGAPLMVLFTSGTTGRPKGIVHTHSGFPLKVIQDCAHVFDVHEGDALLWPTDLGWVLGALTIFGVLGLGGTLVLYDGALDAPTWDRFAELGSAHEVTHLGASPTLIRTMAANGVAPARSARLRVLMAAGEVLDVDHFTWFHETFGGGALPLINYSGGTEVSGGLVANVVHRPIAPDRFNTAVPGVDLAVFDESGRSVVGSPGELVIRRPCVGMAAGFWAAPEQFVETYWRRFPGVWAHGDLVDVDTAGSFRILGRADDTLKIAGKRTGPAEVESIALEHDAVVEAAAIGVPDPIRGESLVLLVVATAADGLEEQLTQAVADKLGKPFAPRRVHVVPELPRTRTGKIMRRLARNAYLDRADVGDTSALDNPSSLEHLRVLAL